MPCDYKALTKRSDITVQDKLSLYSVKQAGEDVRLLSVLDILHWSFSPKKIEHLN